MIIEYGSGAFRVSSRLARFDGGGDGRTLVTAGGGWVEAVDLGTGAVTGGPRVTAMAVCGDAVAVAPAERTGVVVLLGLPDLTALWEFDAGGPVHLLGGGGATVAAVTGDPYTLVLSLDGVTRRIALPDKAACLGVSPDGKFVAVGTDRGRTGQVLLVDVVAGAVRHTLTGPRAPVGGVLVDAGHDVVVAAAGPRVLGWAVSARKPKATSLWVSPKEGASLAGLTPGGRLIAYARQASTVSVDPMTGAVDWEIDSYGPALVHGDRVISARFHDCRELDPATGAIRHTWTHRGYVNRLSAAGDTIVGSGLGSRPMLFRPGAPGIPELGDGHVREVVAVAFDGERFVTSGADQRVCVWARGNPEPEFTALLDDSAGVSRRHHGVALDGGTVFAGSRSRVVRLAAGDESRSERLDGDVVAVVSMPDRGEVLVACSKGYRNGVLYRLDARTLEVRARAKAPHVLGALGYTPGSSRFDIRWATGVRTLEINTFKDMIGYEYPAHRPEVHLTADHQLVVYVDAHRDTATMRFHDIAARAARHEPVVIPALAGESRMSGTGLLATVHADAIRLWDVQAGALAAELPLPTSPGWGAVPHWFPGDAAILLTHGSGLIREVPLPENVFGAHID